MDLDHHPTQEEITEFLLKNEGLGETTFSGFSENTISFLKNISKNNNKEWFEAHKQEYQDYVLKPLKSFVNDLAEWMLCIDPDLEIRPQINKTISKIQRDIRFSRNKLPYKDTVWVAFKRPVPDWKDTPTFFFELSAVSYRYGMGMYGQGPGYGFGPGYGRGMGMYGQYGPGPGYGRGMGMYGAMPGRGFGRGYCPGFGGSNLSEEEIQNLDKQRDAFLKETETLRNGIYQKRLELRSELAKENPDIQKAKQLQSEISELRAQLDQKRLDNMISLKKIDPNIGRGFMGGGPRGFRGGPHRW